MTSVNSTAIIKRAVVSTLMLKRGVIKYCLPTLDSTSVFVSISYVRGERHKGRVLQVKIQIKRILYLSPKKP